MAVPRQRCIEMVVNVDGQYTAPKMKVKVYNAEWQSDVNIFVPIAMSGPWPQFPTIKGLKEQIDDHDDDERNATTTDDDDGRRRRRRSLA